MSEEYGAPEDMGAAMNEAQQRQLAVWRREQELAHKGCILRVLNGKHSLVIGATGSGKTFWMSHVADNYLHRFIFVNPQLEEGVDKICRTGYDCAEEVLEAVIDGERSIEFVPDETTEVALLQLEEIRRGLFQIAADMNVKSSQWWMNMIIDEAQEYAWKGSREDVDNFFRRGRRFGIRTFALTQRPQNISSTIINNIQYQVIFRTGTYESPYFKTYKIPIDEHKAWLMQDYHYILYDGMEAQECEPAQEVK